MRSEADGSKMSLIHKAMKKAEKPDVSGVGNVVSPEEEIVSSLGKKSFLPASLPPRTIGLIVLTVFVAMFAVYMNFCAKKGPKKIEIPQVAIESAPVGQVPVIAPEEVVVATDVAGISMTEAGSKKTELPHNAKLLSDEGEDAFLSGDLELALKKFTEALTVAPDSAEILNSMGLVFKKQGNSKEAEKYYNEAIKKDPACSECLNNLAVLKVDEKDYVSAVLYLKKAITGSETYADPYFNLAVIMEKEGNYKSAVENYKNFLAYTASDDAELKARIKARIEDLTLNWEE